MAAELRIRPASLRDVAGIVALDRVTEWLPHWTESQYAAAIEPGDGNVGRRLVLAETGMAKTAVAGTGMAETGVELVGFAVGMVAVDEDRSVVRAELESIAVKAPARRTGVGSALCKEIIWWARGSGASEIELEVRSASAGAIQLYTGMGFVTAGRRAAYYAMPEDDAVLMRLRLDQRSG